MCFQNTITITLRTLRTWREKKPWRTWRTWREKKHFAYLAYLARKKTFAFMKKILPIIITILFQNFVFAQEGFKEIVVESNIESVQPMTGIVFWQGDRTNTDAIALEFSYMLYNDAVDSDGNFVWDKVDNKLADIASRNHQAIFRFRYAYVGKTTSVPQYIKNLSDYHETEGNSEGRNTWFPDWTHPELAAFTLRFYKAFAERYDHDPRLAFVQVGFGLWAEYHIYDGPFRLGETFPSKAFQQSFFMHLDTVFQYKPWSISIDAASDSYSPFEEQPNLLDIHFGLFDDSFMHQDHAGYNTESWNFFDRKRYEYAPAGGEFSYYTDYDQRHVLDLPDGPYGTPYETFAKNFHISYIIGNDQPSYQTMQRIKDASMASGYKFKIVSFRASADSSIVEVTNEGVAPFYYPAFVAVNGVRSSESLQYLLPDEVKTFHISAGGDNPVLTIESDFILDTQTIGFYGTTTSPVYNITKQSIDIAKVYPAILQNENSLTIDLHQKEKVTTKIFDISGHLVLETTINQLNNKIEIPKLSKGIFIIHLQTDKGFQVERFFVL